MRALPPPRQAPPGAFRATLRAMGRGHGSGFGSGERASPAELAGALALLDHRFMAPWTGTPDDALRLASDPTTPASTLVALSQHLASSGWSLAPEPPMLKATLVLVGNPQLPAEAAAWLADSAFQGYRKTRPELGITLGAALNDNPAADLHLLILDEGSVAYIERIFTLPRLALLDTHATLSEKVVPIGVAQALEPFAARYGVTFGKEKDKRRSTTAPQRSVALTRSIHAALCNSFPPFLSDLPEAQFSIAHSAHLLLLVHAYLHHMAATVPGERVRFEVPPAILERARSLVPPLPAALRPLVVVLFGAAHLARRGQHGDEGPQAARTLRAPVGPEGREQPVDLVERDEHPHEPPAVLDQALEQGVAARVQPLGHLHPVRVVVQKIRLGLVRLQLLGLELREAAARGVGVVAAHLDEEVRHLLRLPRQPGQDGRDVGRLGLELLACRGVERGVADAAHLEPARNLVPAASQRVGARQAHLRFSFGAGHVAG